MIAKITTGSSAGGLVRYLFGAGRANEHTNQRVVAAWNGREQSYTSDPVRLGRALQAPVDRLSSRPSKWVWHCSLRAAPEDPELSDEQWRSVAVDVLDRTGIAPAGDDFGARWALISHGDDHVHLVATLARQDGERIHLSFDKRHAQAACRQAENRLGLRRLDREQSLADPPPTRAELERSGRERPGQVPDRVWLRSKIREAQAASRSFREFESTLRQQGVTVDYRHAVPDDPSTAKTGIKFGRAEGGDGLMYGGSKLGRGLSYGKLAESWDTVRSSTEEGSRDWMRSTVLGAASRSSDLDGLVVRLTRVNVEVSVTSQDGSGEPTGVAFGYVGGERDRWFSGSDLGASWGRLRAGLDDPWKVLEHAANDAAGEMTPADAEATGAALRAAAGKDATLRSAARVFDRARFEPFGSAGPPSVTADVLRAAAQGLRKVDAGGSMPASTAVAMSGLIAAVAAMRSQQRRRQQEEAARTAQQEFDQRQAGHDDLFGLGASASRSRGRESDRYRSR